MLRSELTRQVLKAQDLQWLPEGRWAAADGSGMDGTGTGERLFGVCLPTVVGRRAEDGQKLYQKSRTDQFMYQFVKNDSVQHIDPTGKHWIVAVLIGLCGVYVIWVWVNPNNPHDQLRHQCVSQLDKRHCERCCDLNFAGPPVDAIGLNGCKRACETAFP